MSTSAGAVALWVCYAVLSIGWRAWRQHRRTGDWGIRLGRTGLVAGAARVLMTLGIAASSLASVFDVRGQLGPIGGWRTEELRIAGLVGMAAGVAGVVWSQLGLRDSWRIGVNPGERTELVVDGPYAWSRNPIYAGMAVVAVGAAVAVPNWVAVGGAVLLVAGVEVQVRRVEEPYLLAVHGAPFRRYAARVGRFAPWLGRFHGRSVEGST